MASRLSHKKSLLGWAIRSIKQLYLFWLFRSCSFIIASSQSEAQSLSQAFNILSKIKVLAPSALYYPLPKETNLASRFSASQFTARASQFNILCAGRHTQEKGSAFLRKVWEKYSSISTVPTSLFVVGPIGDCSAFLRSLESYSCVHSVIVDDSFYDLCDIPALAQYCQISISPSPYESFGMSIYESLSSGLPVISSTGTPWSNLNKYNAGAWVTWDILAYLEKLLFFSLLTKSHLEHYSANARQLALDSHRFASKSLSCFQSLL
jgi:glycosyltransferase involved in cell wall biosynthesis